MDNNDELFKFLLKLNRRHNTPDLHSFTAKIENGVVFVECRGHETFIESITYDADGKEIRKQFAGTTIAAVNRLEMLKIDLNSIQS